VSYAATVMMTRGRTSHGSGTRAHLDLTVQPRGHDGGYVVLHVPLRHRERACERALEAEISRFESVWRRRGDGKRHAGRMRLAPCPIVAWCGCIAEQRRLTTPDFSFKNPSEAERSFPPPRRLR
jgi:hypothetical protein